jgi:RES domain
LDDSLPQDWVWQPFATARWRFDSPTQAYRARYAASSARGMLREAFDPDRYIGAASLTRWVVEFTMATSVLDLRTDDTLDAFGLDDQISTSRAPQVWTCAQAVGDLLWHRYSADARTPGIVYRSRTTPQHNANLTFFADTPSVVGSVRRLRDCTALLEAAIRADGFTVEL